MSARSVVVLAGSRSQPVGEEQARPAIEQFLLNDRKRKLIEDDVKAMRGAAKVMTTTAQRFSPTTSWYHCHTSGLIGSPTDPMRRSELMAYLSTQSGPAPIRARMAVGAV